MFSDRIGWSRPESGVGVEFGASAVKVVVLVRERTELRLLAAGREALPPGTVREGAIRDPDAAGAVLHRLMGRLGVRRRDTSVGIGGRAYLVKRLVLPENDFDPATGDPGSEQLREAVAAEAARHVPFHMEDILFDFEPLHSWNGGRGRRLVFGAARRDLVFGHGRAVVRAGMTPRRVEIEPFALRGALDLEARLGADNPSPREPVAVVEVGASHAAVHVFRPPPANGEGSPGAPAELAATVQTPGGGVSPSGEGGAEPDGGQLAKRLAGSVAEALDEAGLRPPCSMRLSGGGASEAILEALRPHARGEPALLDPIRLLDRSRGDAALTFAAGLAFNQLEDTP